MNRIARMRLLPLLLLLIPLSGWAQGTAATAASVPAVNVASVPAPTPFTAQYRVLRDGGVIGKATLTLSARGDDYVFSNVTRGDAGLAALLGLDVSETSRFVWQDGAARDLDYRYHMGSAFKSITRGVRFDWDTMHIAADNGKSHADYAALPGTVDRNLAVLVLAQRVAAGLRGITVVPVAMNDRVSQQHYRISAHTGTVDVPAGRYLAYSVRRSDADNGLTAWFAPPMLAPVQMEQRDGKGTVYLLQMTQPPR